MSLIRYQTPEVNPWATFDRLPSLRDELSRLFDFTLPTRDSGLFSGWTPALDVYDEKDNFVVKAELPGLKKEDIDINLHDGVLTISGERKHERGKKEGETFRSERFFGRFQRSVTLPAVVNASNVKATYKDGVLTIDLPKAEEAKPKQIAINIA
ncbi:MAG TPA: Hsp20/alpha crystallin family protein [Chthoniobacteraceae bacterium]|nr:Hsp20/alpha crystallin family protein [Chthoniobacteraceae bacterium]